MASCGFPGGREGKFKSLTQKGNDVYALDEQGKAWKLDPDQQTEVPFAQPVSTLTSHGNGWLGVAEQGGALSCRNQVQTDAPLS